AEEWASVLVAFQVRRRWVDGSRDLCVSLADGHDWAPAEPVDLYWTYDHPGWQGQTTGYIGSEQGYWQLLSRQAALTCDAIGDLSSHLLEPLLSATGGLSTVHTAFTPWDRSTGDAPVERPATMLNALLRLWV